MGDLTFTPMYTYVYNYRPPPSDDHGEELTLAIGPPGIWIYPPSNLLLTPTLPPVPLPFLMMMMMMTWGGVDAGHWPSRYLDLPSNLLLTPTLPPLPPSLLMMMMSWGGVDAGH